MMRTVLLASIVAGSFSGSMLVDAPLSYADDEERQELLDEVTEVARELAEYDREIAEEAINEC